MKKSIVGIIIKAGSVAATMVATGIGTTLGNIITPTVKLAFGKEIDTYCRTLTEVDQAKAIQKQKGDARRTKIGFNTSME